MIPGKTRFVYACGDVRSSAASMNALVNDSCLLNTMRREAGRHVENYSVAHAVEGTVEALEAVCAAPR